MSTSRLSLQLLFLSLVLIAFGCGRRKNEDPNPDNNQQETGDPNSNNTQPGNDNPVPEASDDIPIVTAESTYTVLTDSDIEYADGLVHDNASTTPFAAPQKLDMYYPDNENTNRPVYMFIHGGGFKSGTKTKPEIIAAANYFASRGWVFASVDYRTTEDLGMIAGKTPDELMAYYQGIAPQEWIEHALQQAESPDQVQTSTAMYTAQRDSKAALRWIVANADRYNINPNYITVGGASAGAITTLALGMSNNEDFRDEISVDDDPTLNTTNLDQEYTVENMVYYWGSSVKLDLFEAVYGVNRYDSDDPNLFMAHGTNPDPVTPYEGSVQLQEKCNDLGIYTQLVTLEGHGHGAWGAQVDGKGLSELSFDFIVERSSLIVQ